jgi:tryptophanyl-tRNA synthetase
MKKTFNPWEVSGKINYEELMKKFGISYMKDLPDIFEKNVLFRRKVVFAHRDIQRILQTIKDKKPFVMMTGLMPTGKFHIGHMLLALQMVFYQKLGAKIYIAVADIEAYNTRNQDLETSRKIALEEYIPNYVALGLDLKKADVYFQSERSNSGKKSNAYYRLQNLLARHASFAEFKAVYGDISPGKMTSALMQASDMLHPQLPEFEGSDKEGVPVLVPVGIDQDPHLRIARDMSKRIKSHEFTQISSTYHYFMPGLDGGKMSSSDANSYITLTDSPNDVKRKINKYAFSGGQPTLEEHKRKGGNPEIDVSFQYLRFFFEPSDKKLKELGENYIKGELSTGELKSYTIEKISEFLKEHHKRYEKAKKEVEKLFK